MTVIDRMPKLIGGLGKNIKAFIDELKLQASTKRRRIHAAERQNADNQWRWNRSRVVTSIYRRTPVKGVKLLGISRASSSIPTTLGRT